MQEPISKRPPDHLFTLVTDQWTEPFWSAAAAHQLVAPRCAECGKFRMPPTPFCPNCRSQQIDWVQLSGDGTVYAYSVVAVPIFPEMADSVPYITAVVELADAGGVRLISNIVEAPLSSVHVSAPVRVVFDDVSDGVTIPRFKLAGPSA